MALTLNDIRTEARAHLKSSVIASNRIDRWANKAQDEITRVMDPEYLKETTTFTTTSGTRGYFVEASINRVLSIVDQTNDMPPLEQVNEKEIEKADPDLNDTGSPSFYSLYGVSYIENQPTAASTISISSSSNTDTTQTVQVVGIVSGEEEAETETLSGTSPVTTTASFTSLIRIVKSGTTTGRVTATSNAGAVTNVTISPRKLLKEMQPIYLWPTPDGAFTMRVRYLRNPIVMRDNNDVPDLPEKWHEVLLNLVLAEGHEFLYEFDRALQLRALVEKQIRELRASQSHKRGKSPVIGERILLPDGIGRLPSNYPLR